jgi:hypothetical protein
MECNAGCDESSGCPRLSVNGATSSFLIDMVCNSDIVMYDILNEHFLTVEKLKMSCNSCFCFCSPAVRHYSLGCICVSSLV